MVGYILSGRASFSRGYPTLRLSSYDLSKPNAYSWLAINQKNYFTDMDALMHVHERARKRMQAREREISVVKPHKTLVCRHENNKNLITIELANEHIPPIYF